MTTCDREVKLSGRKLLELFNKLVDIKFINNKAGNFLFFYQNWQHSTIYKIPSGYIRIQKEPSDKLTYVHAIFFQNPYKDRKIILDVLYYYMEQHKELQELHSYVPKKYRGTNKFISTLNDESIETNDGTFHILRRK